LLYLVFAGGGTGGHLFPAIAVAQSLRRRIPSVRFHCVFFGTDRPIDRRIVEPHGWELVEQDLPPLPRAPWHWPTFLRRYRRASMRCRDYFRRQRPAVVVGTGALASVPAVVEAARAGIATAILNPDLKPGRANRKLAPRADVIFAQWEASAAFLPAGADVRVTGCPVRERFGRVERAEAAECFGLDQTRNTLLVTGASQGARTLNRAVVAGRDVLDAFAADWQVLHLTGETDYQSVREGYEGTAIKAVVLPFTYDMPEALAAADLVVSRSGASTLAEITAVGRASILMPYPYHKDMHQSANAEVLVRASAAHLLPDQIDPKLNGPALGLLLDSLMRDDARREQMAAAAARLGRPDAAENVADQLMKMTNNAAPISGCECLERSC